MNRTLVLASASPRRRDLLRTAGFDPEIAPADLDERPRDSEAPDTYVARLAVDKARAGWRSGEVTIGADTTVACDGRMLGKPSTPGMAVDMLRRLSGRTHRVLTGVAVADPSGRVEHVVVTTRVVFDRLTPEAIAGYVASGEPLDKAGAYGIQGRAAAFVERIDGSYTNVVGLPLVETVRLLGAAGLRTPAEPT